MRSSSSSNDHTVIAAMATFPLISYYLLAAAVITSAVPTLQNPSLPAIYECTFPPSPQLSALECVSALILLPDSFYNIDWHYGPQGGVVINTVLTTLGDSHSAMHLPRMHTMNNCRIKVEMQRGVHIARILWGDVRMHALSLIKMCVGDHLIVSNPLGPGFGGSVGLGPLKITVEYGGGWPIPWALMQASANHMMMKNGNPRTNATS